MRDLREYWRVLRLVPGLAGPLFVANPSAAADWWTVPSPSPGPAQTIGSPAAGCLDGAEALPLDGPGYQVVRSSRNRYYGHPKLIRYIRSLGMALEQGGIGPVYVGDLSQPRGGPLDYGHASHQNGLDADIWFTLDPKPRAAAAQREDIATYSLVSAGGMDIASGRWKPGHARMLELAARPEEVERIFVNAAIKRHLCRTVTGDRSWLRKIRPWYHHDEHFHIRLKCAPEDSLCVGGAPLPPGDGCDETLAHWFTPAIRGPANSTVKVGRSGPPRPKLPSECGPVLTQNRVGNR